MRNSLAPLLVCLLPCACWSSSQVDVDVRVDVAPVNSTPIEESRTQLDQSSPSEPQTRVLISEKPAADLSTPSLDAIAADPKLARQWAPAIADRRDSATWDWPAIHDRLIRHRDASPVDYANVLGVVGGDIPDSQGHYPRRWKRAHGYKVTVSDDWMGDLLALSLAQISPALHSVYADLVTQSALLEASVEIARRDVEHRPNVIATLLDVSELHRRTFRDAVDQAISRIGEFAVPYLLVIAGSIAPNNDMRAHQEYAHFHLDRLDRLGPERVLSAHGHLPPLLHETIAVYSALGTPELARFVFEHLNDPDVDLRNISRAAAYRIADTEANHRYQASLEHQWAKFGLIKNQLPIPSEPIRSSLRHLLVQAHASDTQAATPTDTSLTHLLERHLEFLDRERLDAWRVRMDEVLAHEQLESLQALLSHKDRPLLPSAQIERVFAALESQAQAAQSNANAEKAAAIWFRAQHFAVSYRKQEANAYESRAWEALRETQNLPAEARRMLSPHIGAKPATEMDTDTDNTDRISQSAATTQRSHVFGIFFTLAGLLLIPIALSWMQRRRQLRDWLASGGPYIRPNN